MKLACLARNLIVSILISLVVSGCGDTREEISDRQYAEQLLNQGDYVRARSLLMKLHTDDPTNGDVSVLLASAHAGMAGLNVIDAWRMFEPMVFGGDQFQLNLTETVSEEENSDLDKGPNVFEQETYNFLSMLSKQFGVLGRMPRLNLAGRSEINEGLRVLQGGGAESPVYGRAKLYGVFLNLFQLSGVLRESFPESTNVEDYDFRTVVCEFNVTLFFQNLDLALRYASNALGEITAAAAALPLKEQVKLDALVRSLDRLKEFKDRGNADLGKFVSGKAAFNKAICVKK